MDVRHKKPRVLVIAEAANPEWASVPLVGWKLAQALSKVVHVHLVTHLRNRDAILRQGLIEGRDFTTIDNEVFARPFSRLAELAGGRSGKGWTARTAVASLAYYSFEMQLWRRFSERLREGEFDLVHRVTPLSPTAPSLLSAQLARIGVPFVVGPLNGGLPWPKNFRSIQHAEREWLSHVRWMYKCLPGYRATRVYSSAILVGSEFTYSEMPQWSHRKCVYVPENAVDANFVHLAVPRNRKIPLIATFIGRLVPYKGADVLIEAGARHTLANRLELHIVGDGPERSNLEHLVRSLGMQSKVQFHGWLPHSEAQRVLRNSDIMVLPSVREFGGGVVIEAMAQGVTPIVADYGGPAELVDELTGVKVPFLNREDLVNGISVALERLIDAPESLDAFSAAGRKKVLEHLTWDAKGRQIVDVYNAILTRDGDLTSLGYPARLRSGQ